jgi:alkylation response protein AidB-like acyl-CoA dehydrogenase
MTDSLPVGGSFLLEKTGDREIFIPEHLNEEQKQLARTVEDFFKGEVVPRSEEIEAQKFDVTLSLLKKAGELGLLAAEVPEEYGGLEVDKVAMVAMTEGAAFQGSFVVTMMCHTGIGSWPVIYFGTPEQKKKYLSKLAMGEMIGAYCLTEPGSGSDALGMKSKAVLSSDGKFWILNGEKTFITNGGFADLYTVFAKVDGDKVSAFLVERKSEGLSTGKEEKKLGIKGSSTCSVIMENCKIPKENLLGEIGKGHKIAFNTLNLGRFKLGVGATGGSKYLIGAAVRYAKERKQFGRPISDFGLIRKKIANMTIRTFVSESMNYRTADLMDQKIRGLDKKDPDYAKKVMEIVEEFAIESSIAKIYGSECVDYVCDEGLQTLGGYGFLEEYPFAPSFRNIRINRIFEGTNEINRLLIPAMFFKRAMKGELDLMNGIQKVIGELKEGWKKEEEGPLGDETHQTELAKRLTLYTAGAAAQKFMDQLREKQFIAEFIADMAIDTYAMETAVLRALQLYKEFGDEKSKLAVAIVRNFVNETYPEMTIRARRMMLAVAEGNADEYAKYAKALQRFDYFIPIDTTQTRDQIARFIIDREGYQIVLS